VFCPRKAASLGVLADYRFTLGRISTAHSKRVVKGIHARLRRAMDARKRAYAGNPGNSGSPPPRRRRRGIALSMVYACAPTQRTFRPDEGGPHVSATPQGR